RAARPSMTTRSASAPSTAAVIAPITMACFTASILQAKSRSRVRTGRRERIAVAPCFAHPCEVARALGRIRLAKVHPVERRDERELRQPESVAEARAVGGELAGEPFHDRVDARELAVRVRRAVDR